MIKDTRFLKVISCIVFILNSIQLAGLLIPALREKLTTGDTVMTIIVIVGSIAGIIAALLSFQKKGGLLPLILSAAYMLATLYSQILLISAYGITPWGIISILAPVVFSDVLNANRKKR